MQKTERDHIMTRLSQAERNQFRRIIQDIRTRMQAPLGHRVTARQVLEAQKGTLSPHLRMALEAVVARDEMGPQVGAYPPDFSLKRLDSDARVRLSSFRSKRPVALVFGSYCLDVWVGSMLREATEACSHADAFCVTQPGTYRTERPCNPSRPPVLRHHVGRFPQY